MCLLFFLSGMSSLILEVMWQRKLVLVFGASAHATTAILTAFIVGLALGSLIGARILNHYQKPIKFYAYCELLIAISALLFPLLLSYSNYVYLQLHHHLGDAYQSFFYQKFILTILTILPATTAMGATIPAISQIISRQMNSIGNSVSLAYGVNTLGAVAGTLLCGLYLLPTVGITGSLHTAMGINTFVVIVAIAFSRHFEKEQYSKNGPHPTSDRNNYLFYIFVYFMMGFIALSYQIVWLRMMAIFGSNSVITFISALTVYLAGFGVGSVALFPQLLKRMDSKKIFFISIFGLSLSVLFIFPLYYQFYKITGYFNSLTQARYTVFILEISISLIMMFIPTSLMGLSFPAVCDITSNHKSLVKNSGLLYFAGNIGAALGVVLFGLYIVHSIGLIRSLFLLIFLGFALSILIISKTLNIAQKKKTYFIAGILIGMVIITNHTDSMLPFLRSSKIIVKDNQWVQINRDGKVTGTVVHYKTGKSATVIIKDYNKDWRGIAIDDQNVASTRPDAIVDSSMLAHLPLLLHPNPKNALTVGFGSGGTSWTLTLHDIDVWAVEIEPEVVNSAEYFNAKNHSVNTNKNYHLILDDARNFLYVTNKKFDVISTDVTNIQYKQNANLYTKEYFELMKSRLTDDGVACAWIPMAGISVDDFKILLKTFKTVYPNATLWIFDHMSTYYGILIGTPKKLMVSKKRLKELFANTKTKEDLASIKITTPSQFKGFLHLASDDYDRFISNVSSIHTDDKPVLEFSTPRKIFGQPKDFKSKITLLKDFETKNPEKYFE